MRYNTFREVSLALPMAICEAKESFGGAEFERAVERAYNKSLGGAVDKKIELAMVDAISSKSERFRGEVGKIVRDALESYAKTMWIKRRFWLNQLDI